MVILTAKSFLSQQEFDNYFNFSVLDKTVEISCRLAYERPDVFYLFMQRYTYFNGVAGSCVARLASSIGLSREFFREPNCSIDDEADRGMEVAAKVLEAAIEEHSDKHQKYFAHRTLAQATLKAIGSYACLNAQQRNEFAKTPDWLATLINQFVEGYQGIPGNIEALIKSIGFHIASEILAHREYSIIDKIVRQENSGLAFDKYLKDTNGKIDFSSKKISSWYWVVIHGNYNNYGVDKKHADAALEALNLAIRYLSHIQIDVQELAFIGFRDFVNIQQNFFQKAQQECLEFCFNSKYR